MLLVRNLYEMFMDLPDEALQGAIYRIIFFHVPAAWTFMIGAFVSMVASIAFLVRRIFAPTRWPPRSPKCRLVFGAVNLATGMIWARIIWGIWWAWDARLTFMLISWLMYGGYLMLRQAIDEPTQRARILRRAFDPDLPRRRHHLESDRVVAHAASWSRLSIRRGGGQMDPAMEACSMWNFLAVLLFAAVLLLIRMRQEETAPRARWTAPGSARNLKWIHRNFTYMFYGFAVAWVARDRLCVDPGGARDANSSEEMRRLRQMIETRRSYSMNRRNLLNMAGAALGGPVLAPRGTWRRRSRRSAPPAPCPRRRSKTFRSSHVPPAGVRLIVVKVIDRSGRPLRLRLRHIHAARRPGRAGGREVSEAVPDRQARRPHRRHLAGHVQQLLLAERPGAEQRHQRRGPGALGHQGPPGRHAGLPAARRQSAARRRTATGTPAATRSRR